jgi:hypothetical protein
MWPPCPLLSNRSKKEIMGFCGVFPKYTNPTRLVQIDGQRVVPPGAVIPLRTPLKFPRMVLDKY